MQQRAENDMAQAIIPTVKVIGSGKTGRTNKRNPLAARPPGRPPGLSTAYASQRVSQPSWLSPGMLHGFGFIPRRGAGEWSTDQTALRSIDYILILAKTQPLRVLTMLPDIMPEVGKAVWNGMRLGCGKNSVRLKAMTPDPTGRKIQEAPDGTEAIKTLFESQPKEVGMFEDLLGQNFLMTQFSGMCAVEAVPGPRNTGVKEIWPIDVLTTRFRRDEATKQVHLWQRVRVYSVLPKTELKELYNGYVPLPMERTFYASLDSFPTDPYGRAPMAPLLLPVIEYTAFLKDLLLAWHRVGTPKWDIGFDYEMHAKIAREQIGLSDRAEIQEYVQTEFARAVDLFNGLNADDALFHDIKSVVSTKGSGGAWPNVKDIYDILRWRIVMAAKEMPTLMGIVEGNTETWSSVDWQIYAKGLETLVSKAARPLIEAAQLHLQLLGMPYVVHAEFEPVRANQRMVDAQSEQIEIDNELHKVWAGWQTNDEASMRITGSASIGEMDKEALGAARPTPNLNGNTTSSSKANKSTGPSKAT